jgi:hypothetical protein
MFAVEAAAAVLLYAEVSALPHHTSLAYMPELDGGTWLMIYGGHAQPNVRAALSLFIRPVPDSLFYDRKAGIYLRSAKQPWGPWSEPTTIFNPYCAGQGGYCEQMHFDDPTARRGSPALRSSSNEMPASIACRTRDSRASTAQRSCLVRCGSQRLEIARASLVVVDLEPLPHDRAGDGSQAPARSGCAGDAS